MSYRFYRLLVPSGTDKKNNIEQQLFHKNKALQTFIYYNIIDLKVNRVSEFKRFAENRHQRVKYLAIPNV